MKTAMPTKRQSDRSTYSALPKKASKMHHKLPFAARMDVLGRNKKSPFALIEDGNKAYSLLVSWLRATNKRFAPDKWLLTLADKDRQLAKMAAGTTPKKYRELLATYNRDYFLAGVGRLTVYRLAKKCEPVYIKQTVVYKRTPNASGAYSLTREERARAAEHRDEDWEPASRMHGRGLSNTWKTTDGQLCVIPQEYQQILVRQINIVAPPDRCACYCSCSCTYV